jgi:outer membrane protein TolC
VSQDFDEQRVLFSQPILQLNLTFSSPNLCSATGDDCQPGAADHRSQGSPAIARQLEAQVNDAILQVVSLYWNVVQARGELEVERKSLEAADVSYQHDKRALELGALPPLDIYRSESEVASRRVQMIQGEYAVKRAEDILRLNIGADQDPYFRALDLDLTEKTDPEGELRTTDATTALQQAEAQRPEFLAARYALDNDETGIRLARNHLKPDLTLTGFYQSSGLAGDEFNLTTGELISRGGLGSSFDQLFGFSFPGYGVTLTLNLPIKNRAAQADLGSALVSRHRDLYAARQIRERVMLDVSNSVHQLEQAKLTLTAGKVALDLAQKALAAAQRKYELGSETIFFVLDAQERLAGVESGPVKQLRSPIRLPSLKWIMRRRPRSHTTSNC